MHADRWVYLEDQEPRGSDFLIPVKSYGVFFTNLTLTKKWYKKWYKFLRPPQSWRLLLFRRILMSNKQTDDADVKGPTPPTNPVEFARWVQRPRITPKNPKVQPDDSAMRLKPLEKPNINRSIGTDKPRRVKRKNPKLPALHSTYANRRALKRLLWPKLKAL